MFDTNFLTELSFASIEINIDRNTDVVLKFIKQNYNLFKKKYLDSPNFNFNDTDNTISFNESNTFFYRDDEDLLSKKNKVPLDKNIFVLKHGGNTIFYNVIDNIQSDKKYFIKNIIAYNKFRQLLENEKITDLSITTEQKLMLFSDNYGIHKIDYSPTINLILDENINYLIEVERFGKELKKDIVLIEYLKTEIIKQIINADYKNQINILLNSLSYIIETANKEFRVYLKKFSFEELKTKIVLEKEKYFSSLRDLLSKIFTQIIAIPVSVTAILIAIEKLNTVLLIKFFIGTYILVSFFALIIQINYLFDYIDLNKHFLKEFKEIKNNSGLDDSEVNPEKNKVIRRFVFGYILLIMLMLITITLTVVAWYYGKNKMCELILGN